MTKRYQMYPFKRNRKKSIKKWRIENEQTNNESKKPIKSNQ